MPVSATQTTAYMICTAPRSGSTLLCRLLQASGVAGHPDSHFHTPLVARWAEVAGVTLTGDPETPASIAKVMEGMVRFGRAGGSVFGLRMQAHSFPFFRSRLAQVCTITGGDVGRMDHMFGPTKLIYLRRADKVAQAVSYLRADQSGLWHLAANGTELERSAPPRDAQYDAAKISRVIDQMREYDAMWEAWFHQEQIAPLRLTYKDLAADPNRTLRQVLGYLGQDPKAAQGITPPTRKIADPQGDPWVTRFLRDHRSA